MTEIQLSLCVYKYTHTFSNHPWLLSVVKVSFLIFFLLSIDIYHHA